MWGGYLFDFLFVFKEKETSRSSVVDDLTQNSKLYIVLAAVRQELDAQALVPQKTFRLVSCFQPSNWSPRYTVVCGTSGVPVCSCV